MSVEAQLMAVNVSRCKSDPEKKQIRQNISFLFFMRIQSGGEDMTYSNIPKQVCHKILD